MMNPLEVAGGATLGQKLPRVMPLCVKRLGV
ncbi:MAG: hypothetical protein JWM45_1615 [Pseudonocardiales bacterium]|jgi:hypothetical protein|nr:hypothetical protein [Pseudonocardiales bacterium]